jgi:hypothetical protein
MLTCALLSNSNCATFSYSPEKGQMNMHNRGQTGAITAILQLVQFKGILQDFGNANHYGICADLVTLPHPF